MNAFTKDELQIILLEINIGINRYGGILKVADSVIDLRDKVEAMIHNYTECNHDWSEPLICLDNTTVRSCNVCGAWK